MELPLPHHILLPFMFFSSHAFFFFFFFFPLLFCFSYLYSFPYCHFQVQTFPNISGGYVRWRGNRHRYRHGGNPWGGKAGLVWFRLGHTATGKKKKKLNLSIIIIALFSL
ncbi:hypothetical protein L873DRAFT_1271467 [Choiromyces venosus 120613-1]|uniref:Uncharacterized protein n=1 Tax=Choiromyces venosus 120613-1 TaxID=1336337 RepID=A0A3N4JCS5_9PEZI|nr:hypothetical protein L873DRAFT_1271467 [Choiromyces venosus 120613-1]